MAGGLGKYGDKWLGRSHLPGTENVVAGVDWIVQEKARETEAAMSSHENKATCRTCTGSTTTTATTAATTTAATTTATAASYASLRKAGSPGGKEGRSDLDC